MQQTWVQSLGQEDPLEKQMATHSSVLVWRIPWTQEPGGLQGYPPGHKESGMTEATAYARGHSMAQRVKNLPAMQEPQETWVLSQDQKNPLEEAWQPTPIFLPQKSHGQRSLVGYSPWGHKESDTIEQLSTHACTWLLSPVS